MISRDSTGPLTTGVVLRSALAAGAVLLFFTGLDNYAYVVLSGPKPLWWVVVLAAAAALILVASIRSAIPPLRSPLFSWAGAYFLVTTAWALFMSGTLRVVQAMYDRYRSIVCLLALAIIFSEPRTRRVARAAVLGAVVLDSCLNIAETFGIVEFPDQGRVLGRSAGFFMNANVSALAIVFGLAVTITHVSRAWRTPALVLGAFGVAATFSRGGEISFISLVLLLAVRRKVPVWHIGLASAAIAALLVYAGGALEARAVLTDDTWARLHLAADDSGRAELALKAWRMFLDAPVLGNGFGSTIDWSASVSTHNEYLSLAAEHGILGLLLLPALAVALCLRNPAAVPFALVFMASALFSHNLLEDRASLLAIALAAASYGSAVAPPPGDGQGEVAGRCDGSARDRGGPRRCAG